ncbi:MAG: succinyldiaminopimelate transaminase [Thiobacillaceae bacterium]|nr:succinyldiaminopimelate transaminase [Thiobacillaceae bacterium]MCX7673992.1 succinyldiaminopimelate transaminase [Thiobacillaceae bacterium]MDW8322780.1 succinyldiaminopimelate transaminase [Burkholderiales bacterium]
MNPRLAQLQPYPFQRLRQLLAGVDPDPALAPIDLSIGEPRHPTPEFIRTALTQALEGLAHYPTTQGGPTLRAAIADWIERRHGVRLDPDSQVLPVNGSREALFAFAQVAVDPTRHHKMVLAPNPFYQIYEGAAILAGAKPYFLNTLPQNGYRMALDSVPEEVWEWCQLIYVCSPGNPTGRVLTLAEWAELFELAERYDFVIAADECYSELYFDEASPPLGALAAARALGRDFTRLAVFNSLSKRSSVPGLRSGFVAGDAGLMQKFLLYRTYHGSAMNPAVQAASAAAWGEEAHVRDNRALYRQKFAQVVPILREVLEFTPPEAGFYLWVRVPIDDAEFARELYRQQHVTVLPGSFLAREARGVNPGRGFVRIALVDTPPRCVEAAQRIAAFVRTL